LLSVLLNRSGTGLDTLKYKKKIHSNPFPRQRGRARHPGEETAFSSFMSVCVWCACVMCDTVLHVHGLEPTHN
jgi:hypothetical protein